MSFFRLNGWPLPIRERSAALTSEAVGELRSSWGNQPTRRRKTIARSWRGRAFPMEAAAADTLEGLLEGRGHRWAFDHVDGFFSSAGLGPEAGFTLSDFIILQTSGNSPRCPTPYCLGAFNGAGLVFDAELCADQWTVAYWFAEASDGPWTHKVARSDLARWANGVRNDSLLVNEILVEDGALAIGDFDLVDSYFADLVLLPFNADDDFLAGLYSWLTSDGLRHYWPFEVSAQDVIVGSGATQPSDAFIGGASLEVGPRGRYLELDNSQTQYVDTNHTGLTMFNGARYVSMTCWVRWDGNPGIGDRVIMHVFAGTSATVWVPKIDPFGAFVIETEEASAAGVLSLTTGAPVITQGQWTHIAVTVDTVADSASLWIDGVSTPITQPGRAMVAYAHTPTDLEFGRRNSAADWFWGGIDEVRLHDLPLTEEYVQREYRAGLLGIVDLTRAGGFSKLPRLELSGDVVGGERVDVMGLEPGATYTQHVAKSGSGWLNNSRDVDVRVEEFNPRGGPSLPVRPSAAVLLDDRETWAPNTGIRRPVVGALPNLGFISPIEFVDFPYRDDIRVRSFNGTNEEREVTGAWVDWLEGATQVSAVAFVRPAGFANYRTIFSMEMTGAITHWLMRFNSLGYLEGGARSDGGGGEAFQQATLVPSTTVSSGPDAWIACGHSVDFGAQEQRVGIVQPVSKANGRYGEVTSDFLIDTTNAFNTDRWRESSTDFRIGADIASANHFQGDIAYVAFIRNHMLTEGELHQFFRAFRAGVFR